jgi:hypothetical protein
VACSKWFLKRHFSCWKMTLCKGRGGKAEQLPTADTAGILNSK